MRSFEIAERSGNPEDALRAKGNVAAVVQETGDTATALELFEEQAEAAAAIGDDRNLAMATANAGIAALELGDLPTAERRLRDGLALMGRLEWIEPNVYILHSLAFVAQRSGDSRRAVSLGAAAQTLADSLDLDRQDEKDRAELVSALQADLADEFDERWREAAAADPWEVISRETRA